MSQRIWGTQVWAPRAWHHPYAKGPRLMLIRRVRCLKRILLCVYRMLKLKLKFWVQRHFSWHPPAWGRQVWVYRPRGGRGWAFQSLASRTWIYRPWATRTETSRSGSNRKQVLTEIAVSHDTVHATIPSHEDRTRHRGRRSVAHEVQTPGHGRSLDALNLETSAPSVQKVTALDIDSLSARPPAVIPILEPLPPSLPNATNVHVDPAPVMIPDIEPLLDSPGLLPDVVSSEIISLPPGTVEDPPGLEPVEVGPPDHDHHKPGHLHLKLKPLGKHHRERSQGGAP